MPFPDNNDNPYSKYGKKYANIIQNLPNSKTKPAPPIKCGPLKNGYSISITPPLYDLPYSEIIWDEINQDFVISIQSSDPIYCVTFDVFIVQTPSPNPNPNIPYETDFIWISLNTYRFTLSNIKPSFTLKATMITPSHINATNHATIKIKDILTGNEFPIPIDMDSTLCPCDPDGCLSWPMIGPSTIRIDGKNPFRFEDYEACKGSVISWTWELWVLNTRGGAIILNGSNIGNITNIHLPHPYTSYFSINKKINLPPSSLYSYAKNLNKTTPAYVYVKAIISATKVAINEVGLPISLIYPQPPVVLGDHPWKPQ